MFRLHPTLLDGAEGNSTGPVKSSVIFDFYFFLGGEKRGGVGFKPVWF
jgi:hypothetical protein